MQLRKHLRQSHHDRVLYAHLQAINLDMLDFTKPDRQLAILLEELLLQRIARDPAHLHDTLLLSRHHRRHVHAQVHGHHGDRSIFVLLVPVLFFEKLLEVRKNTVLEAVALGVALVPVDASVY